MKSELGSSVVFGLLAEPLTPNMSRPKNPIRPFIRKLLEKGLDPNKINVNSILSRHFFVLEKDIVCKMVIVSAHMHRIIAPNLRSIYAYVHFERFF